MDCILFSMTAYIVYSLYSISTIFCSSTSILFNNSVAEQNDYLLYYYSYSNSTVVYHFLNLGFLELHLESKFHLFLNGTLQISNSIL